MPELSVNRLEKLFALLSSLKRHDVIAIDKLAARLEFDPVVLRHDLELLRYTGAPPFGGGDLLPIELDEDGFLEVTGAMPALDRPLRLSFEQALALVLALEIAGYAPGDPLVETLSRGAGDGARRLDVTLLARMLQVTPTTAAPAAFEAVSEALTTRRGLAITYRRGDATLSKRVIEPYLLFAEDNQWYVTAYCHLRGQTQNFRLDRIESARLTSARSATKAVTPRALQPEGLALARLRFTDAERFSEREWPGARVKGRHGAALEVDVPYAAGSDEWFARHICGGAGQITVLFPEQARALVRDYARRQLEALRP